MNKTKKENRTMLKRLTFEYSEFMRIENSCRVEIEENDRLLNVFVDVGYEYQSSYHLDKANSKKIADKIHDLSLESWNREYHPEGFYVLDGFSWSVLYENDNLFEKMEIEGSNAYPWCFYKLIEILLDLDMKLFEILGEYSAKVDCFYDVNKYEEYSIDYDAAICFLREKEGCTLDEDQFKNAVMMIFKNGTKQGSTARFVQMLDFAMENGFEIIPKTKGKSENYLIRKKN